MPAGRTRVRRVLVIVAIAGVHVLVVLGLATRFVDRVAWTEAQEALHVRWIVRPPPLPPPVEPPPAPAERRPARAGSERTLPSTAGTPSVPREEAPPARTAPSARVDWSSEAARVAAEAAAAPGAVPQCEPTGRPDATLPPCPRRGRDFEWRPEEKKAGFAGPLPYFRLGKRCIVVPPFFSCGIGKLPEANGALFDGMRDADRERSSVPDVPR